MSHLRPATRVWVSRDHRSADQAAPTLQWPPDDVRREGSSPLATADPSPSILVAVHPPRLLVIQHDLDDHLNELAGSLVQAGLSIESWFTYARPAPNLDATGYDGILALGALVGLKDEPDHPWMSVERGLLEKAVAGGIPTLGICFGAQMLASIAGATVDRARDAEIGWTTVEMDPAAQIDPVLRTLGSRPRVFQFHYDTFDEPQTGEILGRTGTSNQVIRVSERAWGVQFHIEVSLGAIYSWIGTYGDEMRRQGVDLEDLAAETAKRWQEYRKVGHKLTRAFAREITTVAGTW